MEKSMFYVNSDGQLCCPITCYYVVEFPVVSIIEKGDDLFFSINPN